MKKVVFICTGNTCRSPMAKVIFEALLIENGIGGVEADSAGLAVVNGAKATENAILAVKEIGLSLEEHRAKAATRELLESADLIVCMTKEHERVLRAAGADFDDRIVLFQRDISDPWGGDLEQYRRCRDGLRTAVSEIVETVRKW